MFVKYQYIQFIFFKMKDPKALRGTAGVLFFFLPVLANPANPVITLLFLKLVLICLEQLLQPSHPFQLL